MSPKKGCVRVVPYVGNNMGPPPKKKDR